MHHSIRPGALLATSVLVLTLVGLLAACNDEADEPSPPESSAVETPDASDDATANPEAGEQSDDEDVDPTTEAPEPTPPPALTEAPSGDSSLDALDLDLELMVDGLTQPTDMVPATDGTNRLFVTSRIGTIHVIENGELREEPLIDLRDRVQFEMVEQGLLSIALHPRFADTGFFYVNYISTGDENTVVSRFQMTEDGQRAVPESETVILEVEQPHYSHNGGNLKFGPDGYLYIGLGDGENPGDPHGNAQNPGTLLGSILRIDVVAAEPYAVPADNPFVGNENARNEVWTYGLRNPWRFSFHPQTGDMYMVDVGQWEIEEVNVEPADSPGGVNYGWPTMEGDECWEADECDQEGLTPPVVTYRNPEEGCAIIGGYSYFGAEFSEMEGVYFFGDWCSGNIRGMVYEDGEWVQRILIESDLMINAFGLDHNGEIYALNFDEGGGVYRIVAN